MASVCMEGKKERGEKTGLSCWEKSTEDPEEVRRINQFLRHYLEALLGGTTWRHYLEALLGGTTWRHYLEALLGGTTWRHYLEALLGGTTWRHYLAEVPQVRRGTQRDVCGEEKHHVNRPASRAARSAHFRITEARRRLPQPATAATRSGSCGPCV
ncbi:hypothetical protein Bbelb_086360 [Branchiostoma belcheri]|nr:hypothetical protein Bbelb_086360 [Branchiostoma belcheri]